MHSFKSITASLLLLALSAQTYAHVIIMPAMGLNKDVPLRTDVTRTGEKGGKGAICGGAKTDMDTDRFVTADASGTFSVLAINFNPLIDGSRKLTAKVDVAGVGGRSDFKQPIVISKNGNERPPEKHGNDTIIASLGDAKCTGGKNKNRCLVSFTSSSGGKFGNCVVVEQSGKSDNAAVKVNNAVAANSNSATCNNVATATDDQAAKDKAAKDKAAADEKAAKAQAAKDADEKAANAKKDGTSNNNAVVKDNNNASCGKPSKRSFVPVGTRAARAIRALLEELEAREEESDDDNDDDSFVEATDAEIEALYDN